MDALDDHERRILRFIERYQNEFGRTPSYEEIRKGTKMSSRDHVYRDVQTLEQKKYVKREPAISRGLTLLRTANGYPVTPNGYSIPVLNSITAATSAPLAYAVDKAQDWIEITRALIPDAQDVFAIRVRGNMFVDALVGEGDTIVLKRQTTAGDGELVAVGIKDESAAMDLALKRYYRRDGYVWLASENPAHDAQRYDPASVEVQGLVLCVIRNVVAHDKR
jgi:repressor LexA